MAEQVYTLVDIYRFDGIKDLPSNVRIPFAKAWKAENDGNTVLANEWLDKAIEAEKTNSVAK